jgi:hypothetical protein
VPAVARGWKAREEVRHDFDGDGRPDIARVVDRPEHEGPPVEPDRLLLVALGTDAEPRLVLQTACIAMCQGCGGVFGDPFDGLEQVGARSLRVGNYGGSSWRWGVSYTLAWREGAMQVVGYDRTSFHSSNPDDEKAVSINLLTGKATANGAPRRHGVSMVRADDCDAVEALGSVELREP